MYRRRNGNGNGNRNGYIYLGFVCIYGGLWELEWVYKLGYFRVKLRYVKIRIEYKGTTAIFPTLYLLE
jgi:hypothetical protein